MKVAEVKKLEVKSAYPGLEEISDLLDQQNERILIDKINWIEYNYKPEVALSIAYSYHEIFLKYYITENYFKAEKTESNQRVCEDSCVEFFVAPEENGIFFHHKIKDLKGKTFRANFYKYGDMLSVPHYVTWNPVGTEKPDYHQPAYFGLLKFL